MQRLQPTRSGCRHRAATAVATATTTMAGAAGAAATLQQRQVQTRRLRRRRRGEAAAAAAAVPLVAPATPAAAAAAAPTGGAAAAARDTPTTAAAVPAATAADAGGGPNVASFDAPEQPRLHRSELARPAAPTEGRSPTTPRQLVQETLLLGLRTPSLPCLSTPPLQKHPAHGSKLSARQATHRPSIALHAPRATGRAHQSGAPGDAPAPRWQLPARQRRPLRPARPPPPHVPAPAGQQARSNP